MSTVRLQQENSYLNNLITALQIQTHVDGVRYNERDHSWRVRCDELQTSLNQLQKDLQQLNARPNDHIPEFRRLKDTVSFLEAENRRLGDELRQCDLLRTQEVQKAKKLKEECDTVVSQKADLEQKTIPALEYQLNEARKHTVQNLDAVIRQNEETINALGKILNQKEDEIQRLKSEVPSLELRRMINGMEEEITKYGDVKKLVDTYKAASEAVGTEYNKILDQFKQCQAENEKLSSTLLATENDHQKTLAENKKLSADLLASEAENDFLQKRIEELKKRIEELEQVKEHLELECLDAPLKGDERVEAMAFELDLAQKKMNAIRDDFNMMNVKYALHVDSLKDEIEGLKNRLAESSQKEEPPKIKRPRDEPVVETRRSSRARVEPMRYGYSEK